MCVFHYIKGGDWIITSILMMDGVVLYEKYSLYHISG